MNMDLFILSESLSLSTDWRKKKLF